MRATKTSWLAESIEPDRFGRCLAAPDGVHRRHALGRACAVHWVRECVPRRNVGISYIAFSYIYTARSPDIRCTRYTHTEIRVKQAGAAGHAAGPRAPSCAVSSVSLDRGPDRAPTRRGSARHVVSVAERTTARPSGRIDCHGPRDPSGSARRPAGRARPEPRATGSRARPSRVAPVRRALVAGSVLPLIHHDAGAPQARTNERV